MARKQTADRGRSIARIRHLVGFSALIMIIFCTVVFYQGSQGYRGAMREGEDDARRLTHILGDHVELTFLGVDLALRRAIERQYLNSLFGNNLPAYMEQNFRVWLNETPQIVGLALIDSTGQVEVAAHKKRYESWLDYSKGLIGEALFARMQEADDASVFIGKHVNKQNGSLIVMSRRFNKLNGEFGGMVIAAIDPGYFVDFYNSVAFGNERFMSLTLADGSTLAAGPSVNLINQSLTQGMVKSLPAGEEANAVHLLTSSVSGSIKITANRRLANMPIVVNVILDERDLLAGWRSSHAKDIGFLALFTLFGSVLSFFSIAMARQIARAEESEEAAILASQAKSEFLANMSHELRTPLNAIIGFSEMMNSGYFGPMTPKQKERVHDINLCGTHLLQLISDILEFSKGDAGKLELIEEKVDLTDIVGECERIMRGKISAKLIEFTTSIEPGLPALWADKRKIRQILLNLLSNAVKFTPEGGGIKIVCTLDAGGSIHLIVSDTGVGIADDDIAKALSVFGQVHRHKNHEGTGLGLPLCKMYAELHGGKLNLSSKPGEGTTVRVSFPPARVLTFKPLPKESQA